MPVPANFVSGFWIAPINHQASLFSRSPDRMVSEWGRLATQNHHQLRQVTPQAQGMATTLQGGLEIGSAAGGRAPAKAVATPVFCCQQAADTAADVHGSANHGNFGRTQINSKQGR